MLNNVTSQETNTFDEVNKVLNDFINSNNALEKGVLVLGKRVLVLESLLESVDKYNAKVDAYNEGLTKPKTKPKKKGVR